MLRLIAAALAFACVASLTMPAAAQENFNGTYRYYPYAKMAAKKRALGMVIGGRPAGCPRRYCGCAAARHVGLSGPRWNLAANWLRLPRAAPASGMAAARRGHVFILKNHVGGNNWLVYDPNSGRGLTRIHVRSIAGYAVVNPRGDFTETSARKRRRR